MIQQEVLVSYAWFRHGRRFSATLGCCVYTKGARLSTQHAHDIWQDAQGLESVAHPSSRYDTVRYSPTHTMLCQSVCPIYRSLRHPTSPPLLIIAFYLPSLTFLVAVSTARHHSSPQPQLGPCGPKMRSCWRLLRSLLNAAMGPSMRLCRMR